MPKGRNDLCVCGSQKKYKLCCLRKEEEMQNHLPSIDFDPDWQLIRISEDKILEILKNYTKETFGLKIYALAKKEFTLENHYSIDFEKYEIMFEYWFFFRWINCTKKLKDRNIPEDTIAKLCLKEHPEYFTEYEKKLIEIAINSPFSFYLVEDIILEKRIVLKDILLQKTVTVKERLATHFIQKGTIIFCRIITLDDQSIILGFAPYIIPYNYFYDITERRNYLGSISTVKLLELDLQLRGLYLEIMEAANQPIKICNRDGDEIEPYEIVYDLNCSPQEAFNCLASLSSDENIDHLLHDEGIFDEKGNLIKIQFPWLRIELDEPPFNNTVLGEIQIDRSCLIILVNSKKRAKKIKKEIEKLLKSQSIHKQTTIIPLDLTNEKPNNQKAQKFAPAEQLPPDLESILQKHLQNHWKKWFDIPLPALGNITPRKAAKTVLGRERLEAMFLHFQDSNFEHKKNNEHSLVVDVAALKKELKML